MRDLFLPGTRIKRWIVLTVFGLTCLSLFFIFGFGASIAAHPYVAANRVSLELLMLVVGISATITGIVRVMDRFIEVAAPEKRGKIAALFVSERNMRGPKIVVIGGGTGLPNVLMGLKQYTSNLTAVVSMADSGGSTGKLRDEFGMLPPGDIRRSLIALSEETPMLKKLFAARFDRGTLAGHSFGNLFITALREVTGSDEQALIEANKILNVRGQALPVTLNNTHLHARLQNGKLIVGETNIDIPKHNPKLRITEVFLKPHARAYRRAVDAIRDADLIVIGPGDLYTSVIANLLVQGIPEAIRRSKAKKVYVCNLMTKHGETDGYTAADHLREVDRYLRSKVAYIVVNSKIPKSALLRRYAREHSFMVENDFPQLADLDAEVVQANLLREPVLVRHDAEKLGTVLMDLARS